MSQELGKCRRAKATWIHIDVMDGHFVPNLTLGPPLVKCWRKAEPKLFFDTHLMVENPMSLAKDFKEAGSDMITIHVEASESPLRHLRALKKMGVKAGISIKPGTPVKAIEACLAEADLVLVMTVEPGFGGQSLIARTLNKVRELDLRRREKKYNYFLQVDGGINVDTAHLAVAAGADVLVAGSAVFGGGATVAENLKSIRQAIAQAAASPNSATNSRKRTKSS